MTEHEWLECNDPLAKLEFLRPNVSDRKWRLYICGGCRQLAHLFFRPDSLAAVEIAERFADGDATKEELDRAEWCAEAPTFGYEFEKERFPPSHPYKASVVPRLVEIGALPAYVQPGDEWHVEDVVKHRLLAAAYLAEYSAVDSQKDNAAWWLKNAAKVEWPGQWLLDCVIGNPFGPNAITPSWFVCSVVALAKEIYDQRAFDRLPLLADALEKEGCDDKDILAHCRGSGPHVRGCWVVDLLLGKD